MKRLLTAALVTLVSVAASAQALIAGVVVKVDKPAARITLRHGEVKAFDMPPLTGSYRVQDRALLDKVQAGDHVLFDLQRIDNQYTVTRIEVQH